MANTIHVDVVSAEESIFSGEAEFVALPGEAGELGIYPKHTPLITRIKPGAVRIERADNGEEEFVFVAQVFTGTEGKYVSLKETIRGFKMIANGECDSLPEQAFYMVGTIDEAFEKAKKIQ